MREEKKAASAAAPGVVRVCTECDIAGCRHLRAEAAQAAPAAVAGPVVGNPVEALDKIYAVYQRSMGKTEPDAEMAAVVEMTKNMLLSWWGEHREEIRAAMVAAFNAKAAPAAVAGPSQETCQTCQGNGEVVTDWERYKHPLPGDVGDEAVAECQDCDGQGTVDAAPTTQAAPAISTGDAVFAFASMLTALPHVIPFGAAAWATPGVELATAFNAANGFRVSQNFPDGLVFPKITGDLLAVVEKAAAPVAQGDAGDAAQPCDAAWETVLRERDDADDFIDTLLDEVLGADRAEWSNLYGRADALNDVRERMATLEMPAIDRAWGRFEAAMNAAAAPKAALAAAAQGDALDQGVREELSIGKAVNRAARDLPEGWEIRIDLERHAGVVFLIDPDGNETMIEGGEPFSDQINAAIDAARSQAKEGA